MPTNVSENTGKQQPARSKIAGMPGRSSGSYWSYWWRPSAAARIMPTSSAAKQRGGRSQRPAVHPADRHGPHRQHRPARQRHRHPGGCHESSLGFKTSGTLTTLNVQVGSQVKSGDLIAQLDSSNQPWRWPRRSRP
jgi:biotin carboxyl carrier protein